MNDIDELGISSVKPINKEKRSIIVTKVVIHYTKQDDKDNVEKTAQLHGLKVQLFEDQILEIKPHFMQFQELKKNE